MMELAIGFLIVSVLSAWAELIVHRTHGGLATMVSIMAFTVAAVLLALARTIGEP